MSLVKIKKLITEAFEKELPSIQILREIKSELYSVEPEDRYQYEQLIGDLKQQMFDSGIRLPGFEFGGYFKDTIPLPKTSSGKSIDAIFSDNLTALVDAIKFNLKTLKNYFLLNLTNSDYSDYNLLLLHDKSYYISPMVTPLEKIFPQIAISAINEIDEILPDLLVPKTNYIVIVLLDSKKNDSSNLNTTKSSINKLIKEFDGFSAITIDSLTPNKFGKYVFHEKRVVNDFFDEMDFVLSSFLTNTKIQYEEEKIIKKLFDDYDCPILEYRLIAKGFSGASVIEVKPLKRFAPEKSKRFIVKFDRRKTDSKLQIESRLFNKCLGGLEGFGDYTCKRVTTHTHEALLYQYAKSDSSQESYSFATIISKKKNKHHLIARKLIEDLHEIKPYLLWSTTINTMELNIYSCYEQFINADKLINTISQILHVSKKELVSFDFFKTYEKLKNITLNSSTKLCHGDLHTENFFADPSIYLIDFGMSDRHHSLIDFVTLEASIKFKHFPKYLTDSELEKIEKILIDSNTFNEVFEFDQTMRPEVLYLLDIIQKNRRCSFQYLNSENKNLDYYLGLYYMTVKQISFADMNQRYALISMRVLGNYISKIS